MEHARHHRCAPLLRRFWRNVVDENTGALRVSDAPADDDTRRLLHRTVDKVRADMGTLEFNTAIAELFKLNNRLNEVVADTGASPREVVETMTLMLAPLAPHIAEEVWARLGHDATITYEPFPTADPALLVDDEVEIPVQINGKMRGKVRVATGADDITHEAAARADEKVAALLDGAEIRKVIVVPGRMVNFVVATEAKIDAVPASDDAHSTPEAAALASCAAAPSANARVISVDVRSDSAEVVMDTDPSYRDCGVLAGAGPVAGSLRRLATVPTSLDGSGLVTGRCQGHARSGRVQSSAGTNSRSVPEPVRRRSCSCLWRWWW